MRQLFLYITLFLAMPAVAQITLNVTDYPATPAERDTIKVTASSSVFPLFTTGAGNSWDMTVMTDSVPLFYNYHVYAPGYQYADSAESLFLGLPLRRKELIDVLSSGALCLGQAIVDSNYNIGLITTNAFDTLFIPAQTDLYSATRTRILFPATDASSWSSSYSVDLQFALSLAFPFYDHAPGYRRSYVQEHNFVTGWGQAKINTASGIPGDYLDVLQVQTRRITTDSFFLDGGPMPGTLLTVFGIHQGMADTVYEHNYYRKGKISPLVNVRFKDAAYTQPVTARKHVEKLFRVGVDKDPHATPVSVFPQPLQGDELTVLLPAGSYPFTLLDVTGRNIFSGTVVAYNNTGAITLSKSMAGGRYFLCIEGQRCVPVDIQR
jgi:hypothetical protein